MTESTKHKIIVGDSRKMEEVANESVHLIITSPPYWQLKDYGNELQIGFNDTYEDYINNLNLVWNECARALVPGCRLCVNIGDQFARSVYYGRYKVIPIRTEIIKFCETVGLDYMGAIIWQKTTTTNTTGGASIMGSFPYPRNGILKLDYEFILIFKKPGVAPEVTREVKEKSKLTNKEWNEYFSGHWYFNGARQDKHIAMFPEELPRRLIKMFSFVGDTVLDPFLGSGTTTLAAKNLKRNSIGYEINGDFLTNIKEKIGSSAKLLEDSQFEFFEQTPCEVSYFREVIATLPYVFKDPVRVNRKVDPKKFRFGSKIDSSSVAKREEFYTVKTVLGPEEVELNNGVRVKLIGIKAKKETSPAAVAFLQMKLKNQRVFIRFDNVKYDEKNNLLCYLYLQNKTFVNAHLIRSDLVDVDASLKYRYRSKFLSLRERSHGERMDIKFRNQPLSI